MTPPPTPPTPPASPAADPARPGPDRGRGPAAVRVAIGVLVGPEGVLIAQRRAGAVLGGLWEFPGGKLEAGETAERCLAREFAEELGLAVVVGRALSVIGHRYDHGAVRLEPFWCRLRGGRAQRPRSLGVARWRWVSADRLDRFAFPAANGPLLAEVARALRGGSVWQG